MSEESDQEMRGYNDATEALIAEMKEYGANVLMPWKELKRRFFRPPADAADRRKYIAGWIEGLSK